MSGKTASERATKRVPSGYTREEGSVARLSGPDEKRCANDFCARKDSLVWRHVAYQGAHRWLCNGCFVCLRQGRHCPLCKQVYRQTDTDRFDGQAWAECVGCLQWSHIDCYKQAAASRGRPTLFVQPSSDPHPRVQLYICDICEATVAQSQLIKPQTPFPSSLNRQNDTQTPTAPASSAPPEMESQLAAKAFSLDDTVASIGRLPPLIGQSSVAGTPTILEDSPLFGADGPAPSLDDTVAPIGRLPPLVGQSSVARTPLVCASTQNSQTFASSRAAANGSAGVFRRTTRRSGSANGLCTRWIWCGKCGKWRRLPNLDPAERFDRSWNCTQDRLAADKGCGRPEEELLPGTTVLTAEQAAVNLDAERLAFRFAVFSFLRTPKKFKSRIPIVAGRKLCVYRLYREVTYVGGFDAANKVEGTWARIFRKLDNYNKRVTDASNRLKRIYTTYLLQFEREKMRGKSVAEQDADMRAIIQAHLLGAEGKAGSPLGALEAKRSHPSKDLV